jgi:GNAT superfamily N-acetyltransferase
MGQNEHLADFGIEVAPTHRRRGIARGLLANAVAVAKEKGRTLFITGSSGRVPSGAAFLERVGATRGLESHTNQLAIADLDMTLVREWQERAAERASGFELFWHEGVMPDELVGPACDIFNAVSEDVPRGDLQMESFRVTPEHVREYERSMTASGDEIWMVFAREKATGRLAATTMTFWSPHAPYKAGQGITGTLPEFRGLGLGRWIKAAMLERIVNERPEVKFVRTSNADSNAPMLGINRALGFKPYSSDTSWQLPVERAEAYLAGTPTPAV